MISSKKNSFIQDTEEGGEAEKSREKEVMTRNESW
jgi:hypothetical protein